MEEAMSHTGIHQFLLFSSSVAFSLTPAWASFALIHPSVER